MNAEKTPEEQLIDLATSEASKIITARRGRGATVDDPCRLGAIDSLLAPTIEKMLVSIIYGQENVEWFDAGREYHKNGTICEQRVRLGARVNPKLYWAQPGKTYSVFFDISELTDEAPIPDAVKQLLTKGGLRMPLADITLVSRFPLIEVRAKNAVEAARIIGGHLRAAEAQGWSLGRAEALVDNWRNEYELTKENEKTVMQFDMRPCLLTGSLNNLIALTMLATQPKLEEGLQEFERTKSLTNACAAAGTKLVEASSHVPDIYFDHRENTIHLNAEALERYVEQKVRVVGETSSVEIPADHLLGCLVMAKGCLGWKGAGHLFEPTANGFTLTLQDGQTVNRSDAAEFSAVLSAFSKTHPDPANPLVKTMPMLAAVAAAGEFSIRCEHPPPQTLQPASAELRPGTRNLAEPAPNVSARSHPPPLPTPHPESPQWFYYVNRRQHGPVSQQTLISLIEDGTLDEKTIARPADDPKTDHGWTIESLQKWQKKLPPARRIFPALPPNASEAQRIIRAFEEKHGKLLTEMSASQLSEFTDEVTRDVPSDMAIAFFGGTTAEPVLRRARRRHNTWVTVVGLAFVLAVAFGIATAMGITALSGSIVVGLIGGLVLGCLLWSGANRILWKLYSRQRG